MVFSGVFLKELLPTDSALRRGFEQGAVDGSKAAVEAVSRIVTVPKDLDEELAEKDAAASGEAINGEGASESSEA